MNWDNQFLSGNCMNIIKHMLLTMIRGVHAM